MYSDNRNAYRQAFFIAWQKYQKKLPLEAVEAQLIEVILLHPEYHAMLDRPQTFENQEFALEENPFFHLSLHLTVREQVRLNRPRGIRELFEQLARKYEGTLEAEHKMMVCLSALLWEAQQRGEVPDEAIYLEQIKNL